MPRCDASKPGSSRREKLSLLVPSFQHERYLSKLLDSIRRQTRKPDEILVSDDASADGSYELLKGWARGRLGVKIFRQPQNLGITENSNFLLRRTKAELVMFLHSDDLFRHARTLERLEGLLQNNPSAVLAAAGRRFLDNDSRLGKAESGLLTGLYAGKEVRKKILWAEANVIGEPSCVLFRRRCLESGFDPAYRQLWDLEAWLRLLRQGDLVYLAQPLIGIRRHAGQATIQNALEGRLIGEHLRLFGRALAEEGPGLRAEDRYRLLYKLTRTACRHPRAVTPEIRAILSREKRRMGLVEYYREKIRYRVGRWFTRSTISYQ